MRGCCTEDAHAHRTPKGRSTAASFGEGGMVSNVKRKGERGRFRTREENTKICTMPSASNYARELPNDCAHPEFESEESGILCEGAGTATGVQRPTCSVGLSPASKKYQ